jgi:hypothetical protein
MGLHKLGWRRGRAGLGLLVVALTALAVTGCGGGGGKKASKGPSKAEFTKQANAVCKRHHENTAAAANKVLAGGGLPNPRQLGKLALGTIVPQYSAQIKELTRIKPPAATAGAYRKWLADSRATRGKVAKNPSLIPNPASFKSVNGEADKLGLSRDCHIGIG